MTIGSAVIAVADMAGHVPKVADFNPVVAK
jgi:hypothetical protein